MPADPVSVAAARADVALLRAGGSAYVRAEDAPALVAALADAGTPAEGATAGWWTEGVVIPSPEWIVREDPSRVRELVAALPTGVVVDLVVPGPDAPFGLSLEESWSAGADALGGVARRDWEAALALRAPERGVTADAALDAALGLGAAVDRERWATLAERAVGGRPGRPVALRATPDEAGILAGRARLQVALADQLDVRDGWLDDGGRRAVVEETGGGPDPDQALRLANALATWPRTPLLGVSLEASWRHDPLYVLEPTALALRGFASATAGLAFALIPEHGLDWLALCTTEDFILVAGPPAFVDAYLPDPGPAAHEMRDLADAVGWRSERLRRVLRHVDRMEAAGGG